MCFCGGKETTKAKYLEGLDQFVLGEETNACSMPCPGNVGETCGGANAIEVWEV